MADKKFFTDKRIKDNELLNDNELDKVIGGAVTLINGKPIIEDNRRDEILKKYSRTL